MLINFFGAYDNRNIDCIQEGQAKQFLTKVTLKRNISSSSRAYGFHSLLARPPEEPQLVALPPPPGHMEQWPHHHCHSGRAIPILDRPLLWKTKDWETLAKRWWSNVARQRCLLLPATTNYVKNI